MPDRFALDADDTDDTDDDTDDVEQALDTAVQRGIAIGRERERAELLAALKMASTLNGSTHAVLKAIEDRGTVEDDTAALFDADEPVLKGTRPAHAEGQKFQGEVGGWFVIKDGKAVPTTAPGAEGGGAKGPRHAPETEEQRAAVADIGAKLKDGREVTGAEREKLEEGLKHLTPSERRQFDAVTGHGKEGGERAAEEPGASGAQPGRKPEQATKARAALAASSEAPWHAPIPADADSTHLAFRPGAVRVHKPGSGGHVDTLGTAINNDEWDEVGAVAGAARDAQAKVAAAVRARFVAAGSEPSHLASFDRLTQKCLAKIDRAGEKLTKLAGQAKAAQQALGAVEGDEELPDPPDEDETRAEYEEEHGAPEDEPVEPDDEEEPEEPEEPSSAFNDLTPDGRPDRSDYDDGPGGDAAHDADTAEWEADAKAYTEFETAHDEWKAESAGVRKRNAEKMKAHEKALAKWEKDVDAHEAAVTRHYDRANAAWDREHDKADARNDKRQAQRDKYDEQLDDAKSALDDAMSDFEGAHTEFKEQLLDEAEGLEGGFYPDEDGGDEEPDTATEKKAQPRPDDDAHHAVLLAALEYAEGCLGEGHDPAEGLDRLARCAHDPHHLEEVLAGNVQKAWDETRHPRGDDGRFLSVTAIHAAKHDPIKAAALRKRTTAPEERAKLDAALKGESEIGHTKESRRKEESRARRDATQMSRQRVRELASHVMSHPEQAPPELYAELIPHLDKLTVAELRTTRMRLGAHWGMTSPRKAEMVAALVRHARNSVLEDAGATFHGRDALLPEDYPPVEDTAALDAAQAHAERMRDWEADRPGSAAARNARDRAEARLVGAHVDAAAARKRRAADARKKQKRGVDTVLRAVVAHGGIDPNSHDLLRNYSSMRDALTDSVPMAAFRKGGRGLDQLARELQAAGHIRVPEHRDPGEYVLDLIKSRAHSLSADLSEEYDRAIEEHARALEEARGAGAEGSEVEGARSRGEEAGRAEAAQDPVGEHGQGAGRPHGDADDLSWLDDPVPPSDEAPAPHGTGADDYDPDWLDKPGGIATAVRREINDHVAEHPPAPRPAYAPPTDPAAVAADLQAAYKRLPPRAPGDGGPPVPDRKEVAALIGRAQSLSRPLAEGVSSFLSGGRVYSHRMFHTARELVERHEREAGAGNPRAPEFANRAEYEAGLASQPEGAASAPKEPHEMTRAEWDAERDRLNQGVSGGSGGIKDTQFSMHGVNTPRGTDRVLGARREHLKKLYGDVPASGWTRYDANDRPYFSTTAPKPGDQDFEDARQIYTPHEQVVRAALAAGKPVPPEVLADYPDLAPKPADTAAPAPGAKADALRVHATLENDPTITTRQFMARTDELIAGMSHAEVKRALGAIGHPAAGDPNKDRAREALRTHVVGGRVARDRHVDRFRPSWTVPHTAAQVRAGELTHEQGAAKLSGALYEGASSDHLAELARAHGVPGADELAEMFRTNAPHPGSKRGKELRARVADATARAALDAAPPADAAPAPVPVPEPKPKPKPKGAAKDPAAIAAALKDIGERAVGDLSYSTSAGAAQEVRDHLSGLTLSQLQQVYAAYGFGSRLPNKATALEKVTRAVFSVAGAVHRAHA